MQAQIKDLQKQVQALNDPDRIQRIAEQEGMAIDPDSSIKVKTGAADVQTAMNKE
jgi:cell division protein FtsL